MRACSREEFWTLILAKTGTNYKFFVDYVRAKCGAIRITWDRSFPHDHDKSNTYLNDRCEIYFTSLPFSSITTASASMASASALAFFTS